MNNYDLAIGGYMFRQQRELLDRIASYMRSPSRHGAEELASAENLTLLEGLIHLTDAIADQAHDKYGIDCLLPQAEDD